MYARLGFLISCTFLSVFVSLLLCLVVFSVKADVYTTVNRSHLVCNRLGRRTRCDQWPARVNQRHTSPSAVDRYSYHQPKADELYKMSWQSWYVLELFAGNNSDTYRNWVRQVQDDPIPVLGLTLEDQLLFLIQGLTHSGRGRVPTKSIVCFHNNFEDNLDLEHDFTTNIREFCWFVSD